MDARYKVQNSNPILCIRAELWKEHSHNQYNYNLVKTFVKRVMHSFYTGGKTPA